MHQHEPSPFHAVVFRGGDVQFVLAHEAEHLFRSKAAGHDVVQFQGPPARFLDPRSIDRIEPFEIWRRSAQVRLQADGRHVCPYGTVHGRGEPCRCMKAGLLPLTREEALLVLERGRRYLQLPPDQREAYNENTDGAARRLVDQGYFIRAAETHGLKLLSQPS